MQTLKKLAPIIASRHNLTIKQVETVLNEAVAGITSALQTDGAFAISDFGNFSVKQKAARTGRNPQTGAEIQIAARKAVSFKAGTALNAKLNDK